MITFVTGTSSLSGLTVTGGNDSGIENNSILTMTGLLVSGNTHGSAGGGIRNFGVLTLMNSTVSGNTAIAGYGGGIQSSGDLTLINSTVTGNSAATQGGGIVGGFTTVLRNSTISGNTVTIGVPPDDGAGVLTGGTLTAVSTIISGNTTAGVPKDVTGTFAAGSTNNLIQAAAHAGGLTNGANGNIVGVDPLLGPLASNGGPTQTRALLPGSPAINAGACGGVTTDQRGISRPQGAGCDIGAFELVPMQTTTTLASLPNPSVLGQSVTFTATVVVVAPGTGTPTGIVTFKDGATTLGVVALNVGVATLAVNILSASSHAITAEYGGDPSFLASTGSLTQVVNKIATATALASAPNPSAFGQSVTFTATVAAVAPGIGTPTGTVTFNDGATTLGTGTLNAGVATLAVGNLSAGSHSITATYGGDATFGSNTSPALTQTVSASATSTAVASSVNPSAFGQSVTFTATVVVVAPGIGTPAGTVTFNDGATPLGTGTLNAGAATLTTSGLSVGSHNITAAYNGDASFSASTSPALVQAVNQLGTTIALNSSLNPSAFGQSVTFTATVSAVAPGTGTPTGTVTFNDGATPLGTGTLSAGVATLATSELPVGEHVITAAYGGDVQFTASTSAALNQTVEEANDETADGCDGRRDRSVLEELWCALFGVSLCPVSAVSLLVAPPLLLGAARRRKR